MSTLPVLLAIETSTPYGSVALSCGNEIFYKELTANHSNSVEVLSAIDSLLAVTGVKKEQLESISFGRGPGSFTGIRLAISVAQVTAFSLGIKVIPISTLQAIAQQALREHQSKQVLAALDARLNQVYWGCYQQDTEHNLMKPVVEESLDEPTKVKWPTMLSKDWIGIGSGFDNYPKYLTGNWIAHRYPKAYDVLLIACDNYQKGHFISPSEVKPVYIRNQVAHLPK